MGNSLPPRCSGRRRYGRPADHRVRQSHRTNPGTQFRPKVPFIFYVIEGDAPNAFALPGGFIFVYTGLLKLASEESELAAAMAHEIAHVAARHMTCQRPNRRSPASRTISPERAVGWLGRIRGAARRQCGDSGGVHEIREKR